MCEREESKTEKEERWKKKAGKSSFEESRVVLIEV